MAKDTEKKKPETSSSGNGMSPLAAMGGGGGSAPISSIGSGSGVDAVRRIQALQANQPIAADVAKLDIGKSFELSDADFNTRGKMAETMGKMVDQSMKKAAKTFNQPIKNITFEEKGQQKLVHGIPSRANTKLYPAWKSKPGIFINQVQNPKPRGKME